MAPPPGGLARRTRGPVLGVADQLLNAATNVVTAFVASFLLRPEQFGTFVVAFAAVSLVLATGRGLVGSALLVHLPTLEGPDDDRARAAAVRSALGFAGLAGLGAAVLLAAGGLVLADLLAFAPWVALALLHDAARYVLLAGRRQGTALLVDVAWALVQATVLVGWWLAGGTMTIPVLAAAWGLGAAGGLVVLAVVAPALVRLGSPRPWWRAVRDLTGWFTAVAVLGQAEVFGVLLLTGALLGAVDVGGVRAVQLLAFQPPMVLLGALLMIVTPTMARAAARGPAALATARGHALAAVAPVLAVLAVLALAREPLMGLLFAQYTGYAGLVVPVAVQAACVGLALPAFAQLQGQRRASTVFALQSSRAVASVAAAGVGMLLAGPTGLVWALAGVGALTLVGVRVVAARAGRTAPPGGAGPCDPESGVRTGHPGAHREARPDARPDAHDAAGTSGAVTA